MPATSSSRSTYSTPSAMAVRNSSSRCSSLPVNFPPSTGRRQVITTGQGRSATSRLQVHVAVDVVQAQFDQLGALLDQVPMFRDHVPVPAAANADANHNEGLGLGTNDASVSCLRRRAVCRACTPSRGVTGKTAS